MTVAILYLIVAGLCVALLLALAEPWQRQRYDRLANRGLDRVDEWADEIRREARGR